MNQGIQMLNAAQNQLECSNYIPVCKPVRILPRDHRTLVSQSVPTGYIPSGNSRGLAQKTCPEGRDLTFESCPGAGILWKMKLKLQKNSMDQIFTGEK